MGSRRVKGRSPSGKILVGDCIGELKKLATASVDLVFADPPYNLQLAGDLLRPEQHARSTASMTIGTSSTTSPLMIHFARAWLAECRRVLKPDGALWVIGSYHNIFRLGAVDPGSGLLDSERRHLAQSEPDAEFPRQAFHQRARNDDLGGARSQNRA